MQIKKSLLIAALLAVGSLTAVSANAASPATGSFNVLLQVDPVCTVNAAITAQDIDFGTIDAGATPVPVIATNTTALSVQCSKGSAYQIALTPASLGSTDGTGEMTNGTDVIAYSLFSNAAATTPWGSLTSNDVDGTGNGTAASELINHPVYAKLTGSTNVTTGAYIDLVNVSVTY